MADPYLRSDRRPSWLLLIGCVVGIVLLGMASGWLSNSGYGNPWFDGLEKPVFMPPGWAFPVAWTILYVLLGIALALILAAPKSDARKVALAFFMAQMALNFAWSPVFFGLGEPEIALGIIALMLGLAAVTAKRFAAIRPAAAWLMAPYLAWLCFAAALNYAIVTLNPGA